MVSRRTVMLHQPSHFAKRDFQKLNYNTRQGLGSKSLKLTPKKKEKRKKKKE